jgi:hypothetical protein
MRSDNDLLDLFRALADAVAAGLRLQLLPPPDAADDSASAFASADIDALLALTELEKQREALDVEPAD